MLQPINFIKASIVLRSRALKSDVMLSTSTQDPVVSAAIHTIRTTISQLPRIWPNWILLTLSALLIAAPASTKIAGAAWLLVVVFGLWTVLRIPGVLTSKHPLVQSSWVWAVACFCALALKFVATYYWADPWGDRHVEVRLFLGAAATLALVRRQSLSPAQKIWLTHSLAFACWVALSVSYQFGRATPSNAIPWAAGVSFLVCLLLPLAIQPDTTGWERGVWSGSVLAGLVAVLLSQSRGSYGLVIWVVLFAGVAATRQLLRRRKTSAQWRGTVAWWLGRTVAAVVFLTVVFVSFPRIYEEPSARVTAAWQEIQDMSVSALPKVEAINTSVGVRLYMWRMAIKEIGDAPLLGHGSKSRIAWIHALGEFESLETVKNLDHLHSDPLTTLFDHGLLGLLSYLSLSLGLAWVALSRKLPGAVLQWSAAGILWMHLSAGLTNTNFGHNYYGVMLALSLALAWILSTGKTDEMTVPPTEFER